MKYKIFIIGTGHCGSTLLDLMISSHSKIFGGGELIKLQNTKKVKKEWLLPKAENFWLSLPVEDCINNLKPQSYIDKLITRLPLSSRAKFSAMGFFNFGKDRIRFYEQLLDYTNSQALVDSSKNVWWFNRSIEQYKRQRDTSSILLVYVKRKNIAVINSYFRKYGGELNHWIKNMKKKNMLLDSFYKTFEGQKMIVEYEDFVTNPSVVLSNILGQAKLDYEESMLKYWDHEHFQISGNTGTKSLLLQGDQKKSFLNKDKNDKTEYLSKTPELIIDQRWKTELTREQIEIIKKAFDNE